MKKYEYPKEADKDNTKKLVERARVITKKSSHTFLASVVISVVLLIVVILVYFVPIVRRVQNPQSLAYVSLAIASGASLFVSVFLVDFVNIFLRRIFNNYIPYYPSPEEFVFAQCLLTATLFDRLPKPQWAQAIRYRSMYLSEEFSRFTRLDVLNFRRKFYAHEFRLLGSGETQIGRMILFSQGKKIELLTNFAMSLVNGDDPTAFKDLKALIGEIEKYGKLEILATRIENQLKKWKYIVAIFGGIVAIVATVVGLIIR